MVPTLDGMDLLSDKFDQVIFYLVRWHEPWKFLLPGFQQRKSLLIDAIFQHFASMDSLMNAAGSFWFNQKASKQLNSVGNDINSLSENLEGGAKWLVNKVKGKMQKPLPELLKDHDLPPGIFPRDATNYEFNPDTKKLTVFMESVCEVGYKDSSVQRFFTSVTGKMEKGKLSEIEGMKTKMMFIWVKVSSIIAEGSVLHFMAGMKKSRGRDGYELQKPGVRVDKF